jgi:hypothetical protein
VPGVDDPEAGDAVDVLLAVDVVQQAPLAVIEDLEALALGQLDVVGRVDPDVVERLVLQFAVGFRVRAGDGAIHGRRFVGHDRPSSSLRAARPRARRSPYPSAAPPPETARL